MSLDDEFRSLRLLTEHLPFALDDYGAANAAFAAWRAAPDAAGLQAIDLWAYLYVRWYFLGKFAASPNLPATDLDGLLAAVFRRVQEKRDTVTGDYASWVSVVCKNHFRNYLTRRRKVYALTDETAARLPADAFDDEALDAEPTAVALREAFDRLPDFVRAVARRRLLDGLEYDQLSREVDKPVPILRSYVNKALTRLRADPALRQFLGLPTLTE